ncbi:hypothetical protein BN341_4320 [Helicobacter heilmannii ASB1.4]|nr:hypothetical protein BN341_4320 [Helicobacter heilmannii ASB1.4]
MPILQGKTQGFSDTLLSHQLIKMLGAVFQCKTQGASFQMDTPL